MQLKLNVFFTISGSFRRAFEQANKAHGPVFSMNESIEVEKIMQSKYFQALHQQYKRNITSEMVWTMDRGLLCCHSFELIKL